MSSALELARQLGQQFEGEMPAPAEFRGEVTVCVTDCRRIAAVLGGARDILKFDMLLDVCGVDHGEKTPRFEVVYHLYSFKHGQYLRVKTRVDGEKPELPSVSSLWQTANWHEREVFDMMGIRFTGHPDLRRILMWDEYPYHPLRKEFPLAGLPTDDGRAAAAPMEGGPFVTRPGDQPATKREPRSLDSKSRF
ncbi:MAG: NADH-quinone oxidoreductase subunit C [Verrucomicrobiae bacterium]|nr:NADH-quinone oxidoreductase subunit C [Verrucomicrobiae bacterium]